MICLYAERRPFSVSVTQGAALLRRVDEAKPYSDSGGRAASPRRGRASRGRIQRPCGHRARSSDAPALLRSWGLWLSLTFIGHEGSGFTRAGLMPARRTHGRPVPEGPAEARARRMHVGGAGVLSRGPRATPTWATPTRAAPARLADPQPPSSTGLAPSQRGARLHGLLRVPGGPLRPLEGLVGRFSSSF